MTPGEQAVDHWNDDQSKQNAEDLAADIRRREEAGIPPPPVPDPLEELEQ